MWTLGRLLCNELSCSWFGYLSISCANENSRVMLFRTQNAMIWFTFILITFVNQVTSTDLPSLTSAQFSDSFQFIEVQFDAAPPSFENAKVDCSLIFKPATLNLLGTSPKCIMSSATKLLLSPDFDASIQPGITLESVANDTVSLTTSQAQPSPMIKLTQAKKSCLCSDDVIFFNIDLSSNVGFGRLTNVTWNIHADQDPVIPPSTSAISAASSSISPTIILSSVMVSSTVQTGMDSSNMSSEASNIVFSTMSTSDPYNQSAILSSTSTQSVAINPAPSSTVVPSSSIETITTTPRPLDQYEQALLPQQGNVQVSLDSVLFSPGYNYTLRVTGSNIFGKSASAHVNFRFNEDCLPHVTILQTSSLTDVQYISFEADVYYPSCWSQSKSPRFQWSLTSPNGDVNLGATKRTENLLVIDSSLLSSGTTYTVKVDATVKSSSGGTDTISKEYEFSIQSSLMVGILGGDRSIGSNETLRLISYAFSEPDGNVDGSYDWTCMLNGVACVQADNSPLTFGNTKVLEVNIPNVGLAERNIYAFKLSFTKNDHTFTDTVQVEIVDGKLPSLSVSTNQKQRISSSSHFLFTSVISGKLHGSYSLSWQCFDSFGKAIEFHESTVYNMIVSVSNPKRLFQMRTVDLHLPSNTITGSYSLTCECALTFAGLHITAKDVINFGDAVQNTVLVVSPSTGDASKTSFRIRAYGWTATESQTPLLFRFGYKSDDFEQTEKFLTGWTTANILDNVYFPIFNDLTSLDVFVLVKNKGEILSKRAESTITLKSPKKADIGDILIDLYNKFEAAIDSNQMVASQYLYNKLSIEGASSDTTEEYLKYIGFVMSSPATTETLSNAVDVTRLFFDKRGRYFTEEIVNTTKDFLLYLTDSDTLKMVKYDDIKNIVTVINSILNNGTYQSYIYPHLTEWSVKLTNHISQYLNTHHLPMKLFETKSSQLFKISVKREHFETDESDTIVALKGFGNITNYVTWNCANDAQQLCNGLIITQVEYDKAMYVSYKNFSKQWKMVSNVYDVRLWNPVKQNKEYKEVNTSGSREYFHVVLPNKDAYLTTYDDIYCQVLDDVAQVDNTSLCEDAIYLKNNANNGKGEIQCRCQKLGKIAVFKEYIEIITTLEPDTIGDNITFSLYFYAPKSMCIFRATRFKHFSRKLVTALALELNIDQDRITILGCDIGSIIVYVHIIDEMGKRRNVNLIGDIQRLIYRHEFSVTMKAGTFLLFDVMQTTPKPPPPTIPPIGEVDTDWLPIGISIGVIILVFFLCGVITCCLHTQYLKNKVFTDVNSDPVEPEPTEEEIEMKSKKEREKKLTEIHEEAMDEADSRKNRNAIAPVGNSNAIAIQPRYMSNVNRDEPRLALDDSSDEDEQTKRVASTVDMFRASSTLQVQNDVQQNTESAL